MSNSGSYCKAKILGVGLKAQNNGCWTENEEERV